MNHLAKLALAVVALGALATAAPAAIVYSGVVNLAVPNTAVGLYLNFVDGTTYTGPSTFPVLGGPGANYDINIYGTSTFSLFAPGTSGQSAPTVPTTSKGWVAASTSTAALSLTGGTEVGAGSVFSASSLTTNIVGGTSKYMGVRFRDEGANLASAADDTVHYAWVEVQLTNGTPGKIVRYAYENTAGASIAVGAVPEPASMTALGVGALALLRRRRKA